MEKAGTSASSAKDSSGIIRLIHSVQALIPAMGNTAANTDKSAKKAEESYASAKQTAASLVPALGDSKDTQKQTDEADKNSASGIFSWLKKLFILSSGMMKAGAQTAAFITGILYLKNKIKEYKNKCRLEELEKAVKGTNPNFKLKSYEWTNNCQRCVSAFEARMRGQKVTARPRIPGCDPFAYPNAQKGGLFSAYKSPDIHYISSTSKKECEQIIRDNMTTWGEGSRAIVVVYWEGGGGHTFNAVQINGETRYVDPQTGSMDCSDYFEIIDPSEVYFARTDNQEFTARIHICIQEEPKGELP